MMPSLPFTAILCALLLLPATPESSALTAKPIAIKRVVVVSKNAKADDEYIAWAASSRLSWDDFLCAPVRNTDAVASTSTALGIAYQIKGGKLTYQITCKFSKNKSWGLVKTPYILAHEQGHFDITEIFARKLYQVLQSYTLDRSSFQSDINTIYESIVQAKEAFQQAYDNETDHSRNKRKQIEWLVRIDDLLQATKPYAGYP